MNCECGNYDSKFIENLQSQIYTKLAYVTNRDLANIKYNLGMECDVLDFQMLDEYAEILDKILQCTTCFQGQKIEDVVSQIKNKISLI